MYGSRIFVRLDSCFSQMELIFRHSYFKNGMYAMFEKKKKR